MQEHCHAKLLATLYSLLAAVLPFAVTIRYSLFATRHSPFTIRCRFTICRSHSLLATRYSLPFRLGRSLALPFFAHRLKSVATKTKPAKAG